MALTRPFYRTFRPFVDGAYFGKGDYIKHSEFARFPEQYVRGFLILQKDLQELFDYIEPSDENLKCYSHRINALLLRTCVEVEANFKAILTENHYSKKDDGAINIEHDYWLINKTHHLSSYKVKIPYWRGKKDIRSPFCPWKDPSYKPLKWYQAYNTAKHNRAKEFKKANLDNLLDAICGLLILLSAQFGKEDFSSDYAFLIGSSYTTEWELAIGSYFQIKFPKPDEWPEEERYDFDWESLKREDSPFRKIDYDRIKNC